MPTTTKLRPRTQELRPPKPGGRKSDYEAGFANREVAAAWSCCPGRVSKKWEPFCESLLAAYRFIGRQRLSAWLASLSPQSSVHSPVSDDDLALIWHRSPGFVREHKRRPFEANMAALHELDAPGFWLLISELDFRERIAAERREARR